MQNNVSDRLSCPNCGRIVRWNDAYCSACGAKLEQREAKPIRLPALNRSVSRSELWGIKPKAKPDVETEAQDLPSDSSLLQEDERLDADSSPLQEDERLDADSSPLQEDERSDADSSPLQEDEHSDSDSSLLQEEERSDSDSSPLQEDERSDSDSSPLQEDERSDDEQNQQNDASSSNDPYKTPFKYRCNYPKLSFGLFVLVLLELFAFIPYVFVVLCVFKYNVFCDVLAILGTVVLLTHGVCVCASYVVALIHARKNKYEEVMKDMDIFRRLLRAGAILFSILLLAFVICLVYNDSAALPPKAADKYTPVSFDD